MSFEVVPENSQCWSWSNVGRQTVPASGLIYSWAFCYTPRICNFLYWNRFIWQHFTVRKYD